MMKGPVMSGRRSAFIDYLRCAAFLSVFMQHVLYDEIERLAQRFDGIPLFARLHQWVHVDGAPGVFGVVLFFMISGYCITHAARRENAGEFAVRRVLRIYPLLVIALVSEILLASTGVLNMPPPTWRQFIGSATLAGDFLPVPPRLAGVEWTLRLEFLFYVLVGAWLVVRGARSPEREGIAPLPLYLGILALIALAPAFPPLMWTRGYINLFAPFLVVGVAFAALERGRLGPAAFVAVIVASLAAGWWTQHAIRPDYGRFQGYYAAALTLFGLAWLARGRIRTSAIVYRVALLTYATYLFHGFAVRALERGLAKAFPAGELRAYGIAGINDVAAIAVFFALMALLVVLVEQPLVRWSKRLAVPFFPREKGRG